MNNHKHWKEVVKAGEFQVKLSALKGAPDWLSSRNKMNGRGVYLNYQWAKVLRTPGTYRLPKWPDYDAVSVEYVFGLVKFLVSLLKQYGTAEIACHGGHGRTGTLYACLLVYLEHLSPREAIEAVWTRHCYLAIENMKQMRLIYQFSKYLKNNCI